MGKIVAIIQIQSCVESNDVPESSWDKIVGAPTGRFVLKFGAVVPLSKPIECTGERGFWWVDAVSTSLLVSDIASSRRLPHASLDSSSLGSKRPHG